MCAQCAFIRGIAGRYFSYAKGISSVLFICGTKLFPYPMQYVVTVICLVLVAVADRSTYLEEP